MKYLIATLIVISLVACGHKEPPLMAKSVNTESIASKPVSTKIVKSAKPVGAAILADWIIPDEVLMGIFLALLTLAIISAQDSILGGLVIGVILFNLFL